MIEQEHAPEEYTLRQDGELVGWALPHTAAGAITALNHAHWFSMVNTAPCEVLKPDGSLLARWVRGERTDLAPVLNGRVARVARHM